MDISGFETLPNLLSIYLVNDFLDLLTDLFLQKKKYKEYSDDIFLFIYIYIYL